MKTREKLAWLLVVALIFLAGEAAVVDQGGGVLRRPFVRRIANAARLIFFMKSIESEPPPATAQQLYGDDYHSRIVDNRPLNRAKGADGFEVVDHAAGW